MNNLSFLGFTDLDFSITYFCRIHYYAFRINQKNHCQNQQSFNLSSFFMLHFLEINLLSF
jgi:hypothetical protein